MDYRQDAPKILRDFLIYHETIKGHSKKTVDEYYLDLRTFFRFLKLNRNIVPRTTDIEEIPIYDIDLDFVKTVTLTEVYEYLSYLSRDRIKNQRSRDVEFGISAASRARKIASIKSFYKYLTIKAKLIEVNPVQDLDSPKLPRTLPKYLSLDESRQLLNSIDGKHKIRDYCIICIFLNCGLRISEIVGLNLNDIRSDSIRVMGKGNKERIVYFGSACRKAIDSYLVERNKKVLSDNRALFGSRDNNRISVSAVHRLVKKALLQAGLDSTQFSAHKLRHTAATMMLSGGVDVKTVQEVLGHENLNTTQIYTHIENTELKIAAEANPLSKLDFSE